MKYAHFDGPYLYDTLAPYKTGTAESLSAYTGCAIGETVCSRGWQGTANPYLPGWPVTLKLSSVERVRSLRGRAALLGPELKCAEAVLSGGGGKQALAHRLPAG